VHARLAAIETGGIDLAGSPVTKTVTLDGIKLIGEDRRWLLVRTSGTEPLARVYAEARDPETVESLLALGQSLLHTASEGSGSSPEPAAPTGEIVGEQPAATTRPRPARSRTYTRQRGG
jgi:hypothetical protein